MREPGFQSSSTRFRLRARLLNVVHRRFTVSDERGADIAWVKQRGFKLREDIRLYGDVGGTAEIARIATESIIDFAAAYQVIDTASDSVVGGFRRRGFASIMRDQWEVLDETGAPIGEIVEDNATLAVIRRVANSPLLLPQSFDVRVGGRVPVTYRQRFNPFRYTMDIEIHEEGVDPLLAISGAILLAAIDGRQS